MQKLSIERSFQRKLYNYKPAQRFCKIVKQREILEYLTQAHKTINRKKVYPIRR